MQPWTNVRGAAVIAHISDLHFGSEGAASSWSDLAAFLRDTLRPELICVTGDIVDTPRESLYDDAYRTLHGIGVGSCVVCAGNHDRHPRGNVGRAIARVRALFGRSDTFAEHFASQLAGTDEPRRFVFENGIRVGVLAIDTSRRADFFARGYVPAAEINHLRGTIARTQREWDLCLLLAHHHPLPVRTLESERRDDPRSLLAGC